MRLIYSAVTLLVTLTAQAQTDSVRTTYAEEVDQRDISTQRSGSRFVKAYRKFIREQFEETTLIKLGALPQWGYGKGDHGYVGFNSEIAVEQKLIPAVSVLTRLWTYYRNFGSYGRDVSVSGQLAGRWYYSISRRIREGKSANNFSNQYFMLQTNLPLYTAYTRLGDPLVAQSPFAWSGLAWGSQRRLGKWGYADINIGLGYPLRAPARLVLSGSLMIGVGL